MTEYPGKYMVTEYPGKFIVTKYPGQNISGDGYPGKYTVW